MASWWLSEAIPLPATGLVPLVIFPILDISTIKQTAQGFSHPIIFLFMGGFIIGLSHATYRTTQKNSLFYYYLNLKKDQNQ